MKIYTILFVMITFLSYFDSGLNQDFIGVDILVSIIGSIGLWGYVYKKEWLPSSFWKVFFGFNIVWIMGTLYYMSEDLLPKEDPFLMYFTLGIGFVTLLLHIPYFYALFQYAYRRG